MRASSFSIGLGLACFALAAAGFVACGEAGAGRPDLVDPRLNEDAGETDATENDVAIIQEDAHFADPDAAVDSGPVLRDPETCDEAKREGSYLGCEFYPTVLANPVWSIFDFAVAVANPGKVPVTVTVKRTPAAASGDAGASDAGATAFLATETIPPGELRKIYLPWVRELKGPDLADRPQVGQLPTLTKSVLAKGGAYVLESTRPVVVYQFNAIEAKGVGGPAGKDWSKCPGSLDGGPGCSSFTNDASLLLPAAALTGSYRITGMKGWTAPSTLPPPLGNPNPFTPPLFSVTGTANGTNVTVKLPATTGKVVASVDGAIAETAAGGTLTFALDRGDVAEIVGGIGDAFDFSGALVSADKPVQVLTGVACTQQPAATQACDHIEESVLPAETLGKHYVISSPTGPRGKPVGRIVRVYGNFDGTTLTYKPSLPSPCPATLNAGQVGDCTLVNQDLEIEGDKPFAIATFMIGGSTVDPGTILPALPWGDPSQSSPVAVEQYRRLYQFLAPDDYAANFLDITGPGGVKLTLDGQTVTPTFTPIPTSTYGVYRVQLGAGQGGAHTLVSDRPVGIQVLGYHENTSYQYPGGLNLGQIAPKPPN